MKSIALALSVASLLTIAVALAGHSVDVIIVGANLAAGICVAFAFADYSYTTRLKAHGYDVEPVRQPKPVTDDETAVMAATAHPFTTLF